MLIKEYVVDGLTSCELRQGRDGQGKSFLQLFTRVPIYNTDGVQMDSLVSTVRVDCESDCDEVVAGFVAVEKAVFDYARFAGGEKHAECWIVMPNLVSKVGIAIFRERVSGVRDCISSLKSCQKSEVSRESERVMRAVLSALQVNMKRPNERDADRRFRLVREAEAVLLQRNGWGDEQYSALKARLA